MAGWSSGTHQSDAGGSKSKVTAIESFLGLFRARKGVRAQIAGGTCLHFGRIFCSLSLLAGEIIKTWRRRQVVLLRPARAAGWN
jgi:hypothetical protein